MKWVKKKLRNWLGVTDLQYELLELKQLHKNLTTMGVDVHFKSPSMIIIFSKLKGGQIRHIEADFKNLKELTNLVKHLKHQYGISNVLRDAPFKFDSDFFDFE